MVKKRTSLDSILPPPEPKKAATSVPSPTDRAGTKSEGLSQPPKTNTGNTRKQLAVHLEVPVYQQLRTIAFEEETKMHPLLLEGLDRVFADRGLPSMAELLARTKDE